MRNDIRIYVRSQGTYTQAIGYNLGSKRRNRVPGRGVSLRAGRGEGNKVKHRGRKVKRKQEKGEREDTIHNEAGYNKEADKQDGKRLWWKVPNEMSEECACLLTSHSSSGGDPGWGTNCGLR